MSKHLTLIARSQSGACNRFNEMEVLNMAWRPTRYLKEGQLENTTLGKVTGWMEFAGMKEKVTFNLGGDFHRGHPRSDDTFSRRRV